MGRPHLQLTIDLGIHDVSPDPNRSVRSLDASSRAIPIFTRTRPALVAVRYIFKCIRGCATAFPVDTSNSQKCQGHITTIRFMSTSTSHGVPPAVTNGRSRPRHTGAPVCGQTLRIAKNSPPVNAIPTSVLRTFTSRIAPSWKSSTAPTSIHLSTQETL